MVEQEITIDPMTQEIADMLNEANPIALGQIQRMIEKMGEAQVRTFVEEAQQIDMGEGLTVKGGKRRRTLGGVFFYVAKGHIKSKADKRYIWPNMGLGGPKQEKAKAEPPFNWGDRVAVIPELIKERGEARTMKITLIGRPGKVTERGNVVLTSMQGTKAPSLPKGLPTPPPAEGTTYIVFIAMKQWRRVAEAIKDPDDALIIEGYPFFDKRMSNMAVLTQSVTTRLLQQKKREAQKAKA